jgi:ribosomal protein L29
MKMKELRTKSPVELDKLLTDKERELFTLQMELATRKIKTHSDIPKAKRLIARIKTLQNEPKEEDHA